MLVYSNNAIGHLNASVSIGATTLVLETGDGANFPSPTANQFFYVRLGNDTTNEVVKVTGRAGDTFTCEATSSGWDAETLVICSVAAEVFDEFLQLDAADQTVKGFKVQSYAEVLGTPSSSSGVLTINLDDANLFSTILTEDITTLTISNVPSGVANFVLIFTQDGTGSWGVTWPASFKWPSGNSHSVTAAAGSIDVIVGFSMDGGSTWLMSLAGADYS